MSVILQNGVVDRSRFLADFELKDTVSPIRMSSRKRQMLAVHSATTGHVRTSNHRQL